MLIIKRNGNYLLPKLFVFQKTALENANHSYQRNDWITLGSVQFSCSVMSSSVWPHGLQYDKLPCPSTAPGVYSNSCLLSWWCHPIILSSVISFSSCLQSFPASGVFSNESALHIRQPKYCSFNFSICLSNEYSVLISSRMDWLALLAVQGTLKSLVQHHSSKGGFHEIDIIWPT